ncbi:MAG: hypothetical protein FWC22_06925 [Treponema sp.]|nr:hypothetical protein [Treponema sp.]
MQGTITGNKAENGGGAALRGESHLIISGIISENSAGGSGSLSNDVSNST